VPWQKRSEALTIGRGLNGKLEAVSIGRSKDEAEDDLLRLDLAQGISTWVLPDKQGAPVGRLVGLPTRAVKGRRWDGSHDDWRSAPDQYAAVHFHTDDQGDQQWPVTAVLCLPGNLATGVYAVELSAGRDVDHLPIVVRRKEGRPAPLLVLLPSMTYLAYTGEHYKDEQLCWPIKCEELAAKFGRANDYHSMYDMHADASPVILCSLRRPLLCLRPDHYLRITGCEHGFSADLHLLGWLARQGFAFDVVTDHDLDIEGADLLKPYRGVLTGGHPEYMSARVSRSTVLPSAFMTTSASRISTLSRLNGWPARTSVNASSDASRCLMHDSRTAWIATPSLQGLSPSTPCRSPGAP
jgi:N,N-dimethylformamidase